MSTSIILLDQNSNANNVDIIVFEPCVLFPLAVAFLFSNEYGNSRVIKRKKMNISITFNLLQIQVKSFK